MFGLDGDTRALFAEILNSLKKIKAPMVFFEFSHSQAAVDFY
jgi:hypothetical protein